MGRFIAGVATGMVLAAGTAWLKELSTPPSERGSSDDTGARRATITLSLGFGLGPLVAGIVAQWAPMPLVTAYVPHLVLGLLALPAVWLTPETMLARGTAGSDLRGRLRVPRASRARFLGVVMPGAPWVFAAPSIAFAVLPSLVIKHTGDYAVVFGGVAACVALGVGVAVQPLARRLDSRGQLRGITFALLATAAGMLVAAVAVWLVDPAVVLLAAVLLGAGYGTGLVGGLRETQHLAGPDDLAGLTAIYYSLTYVGMAVPLALAGLTVLAGYPTLLCCLAALAILSLLTVRRQARRNPVPLMVASGK